VAEKLRRQAYPSRATTSSVKCLNAWASLAALAAAVCLGATRPAAGPVEILPIDQVRPGMQATAWTVFSGMEPEAVPVEILGVMRNVWGPRQHIILGRMGGKAAYTSVAGGMSGSPVYYQGKLLGAVSLRVGNFSPEAICGITPIELMLEINELDQGRPADARTPERPAAEARLPVDRGLAAAGGEFYLTPIQTPVSFTGFHPGVLRDFGTLFRSMGMAALQGGGSSAPPAAAADRLRPGDAVSAVLVSGDLSIAASGTVTSNDGRRVLAFGHPFFNLGPIEMPMARAEVVHVLASSFAPSKIINTAEVVGAVRQDRHSGLLGMLDQQAATIPVAVKVRSFGASNAAPRAVKSFSFQVFQNQKWTPQLMMFTLYNCVFGLNDFAEESTFRLNADIRLDGEHRISLATMQASSDAPMPAPLQLAGWFGDKVHRLLSNSVQMPRLRSVEVSVDLLPERRVAIIESAWTEKTEVYAGEELSGKVFLRPYRGEPMQRSFSIRVPAGIPRGPVRLVASDAETLNRHRQLAGSVNRLMDVPETVSLLNQEPRNNQLYVVLLQPALTAYYDDKTLPNIPATMLNVLQAGREPSRRLAVVNESPVEQVAIPFDFVVSGSYSLAVTVK